MAGQIKEMIDTIISQRAKGNSTIEFTTKTKFILKGVNPDRFDRTSPDDPLVVAKVREIALDFGIHLSIVTAYSSLELPGAVNDLRRQCGETEPRLVLCFASTKYDPNSLIERMRTAFPKSTVVGCSTAGEIASGKMLSDSVVAMFLNDEIVEKISWGVVPNLDRQFSLNEAFAHFERDFGSPVESLDIDKYVGLVLVDGMSGAEERLMEKIGDRCDIQFVGGSAGDDLKFQTTHVMAGGEAFTNAAVLVLLRLKNGFGIVKTQSFRSTGKVLAATQVDEPNRTVIQFNHMPAVEAYAEAVGVSADRLGTQFMKHPLGLMVDGTPFVRSPQRTENGAIVFYCQIKEGMELEVLEATDIVADTRQALQSYIAAHGKVSGMIDFHCILRTLQLRDEDRCDEYGAVYGDTPAVGFSTYGEEYLGHINQTSTILMLH